MKRRTVFGVGLALLASLPTLAQSIKLPKREPLGLKEPELWKYDRFMFISFRRFDGFNVKQEQFRIKTRRYPVGTEQEHVWEHTIPYRLMHQAEYVAIVDGPVLKDSQSPLCHEVLTTEYMMSKPFRDDDWLIENGYRVAHNESYTAI